ncbi:HlyD family type I secretion periplasmic adaptor subunit [Pseudomonas alliivorans]|uniref:HlyD family type I secretion periplasmic adaptor subunit n=1 Tax=Pseudomonas alliivorans TaxID=2810613 RepID=UPI001AE27403|nr:HlyD family type I secretion periplasmic adaptor subunit [Pseudomonas alliivorans]MBP0951818.1 HlyD family type I secretion periplasmic adaptor subunit [Pseudomonas alliivorans]MEE4308689.1 HlyD family type I secretion periplasmic adaptor subunit [Pseudomonas alliivorans]MEE4371821.1 HlyD family type I secretion periplasmic adaptor subunit [Pseudomonas alliivorans]MEE4636057.1 HlyD family type I secretion periplasmic adaptor subunit [Pseudomonas alliivorans]MEE4653016.1 HlyD family type I s
MSSPLVNDYAVPGKERGVQFFTRAGWLLTLVGAGSFFLWASLAPLDQGIAVQGTVVVSGKRKAVQSLDSGVVSRILVTEGQAVKEGEPLFRLDQTQVEADVQSLRAQYRMAWASLARWQSERDNLSDVNFPAELIAAGQGQDPDPRLAMVLEGQRQLFSSRRQALAREQAGLQASIEGAGAQLAGMRRARADLLAQADSLRQQLSNLQPLAQNGFIPRNRLLEYERQLSQVQQEMAQNAGETGRIEQGIVESRLRLQQQREEYQKEVRTQWADAQVKTLTLEQQLASAGFSLQHSEILAPADGIAVNLGVHTEGAVVRAGQTLLEVVPQGTRLEVEGRLPVNLVDKVGSHLPVDILFTAFNQNSTPRVTGEVSLISADQLEDEKTGQPYYVLRTSVSDAVMEKLNGLVIKPGMPAEMFVRTGERSLLNYLFKPLLDRAGSALTEE